MIYIVWPEKRYVTDDQIDVWYEDAVANDEIDAHYLGAETTQAKAEALDDAGLLTIGKQGD
jgi:hypothetical protein